MKSFTKEIFNQVMYGTTEYYTPAELNSLLGYPEKFMFQAKSTQVSGTSPTLTIKSYHSNDGQNWVLRATVGTASLGSSVLNVATIQDTGTVALGAFHRLGFSLSASDNVANVSVSVCGRGEQSG